MIKTILIDDEQHCIDRLLYHIKRSTATFTVMATCSTVWQAVEACKLHKPDLVFLDIEIQEKTGFDFLREMPQINFQVIFTTAFDNYSIEAFKFSALHYLLKPIDIDDFNEAVRRYLDRIKPTSQQIDQRFRVLLDSINNNNSKLTLPTATGYEFVEITSINRCEADGSYTHIFTLDKQFTVSKPLKHYENLLENLSFYRVHNSHLINLKYVKQYTKGNGGYLTMEDGTTINVSARRKDGFLNTLNS
ncbi:DNA-binding response regulator [Patiriisocius marinistellae]|uniref:DNA-binding response regulator n=1 Tax=Patiriisocius marinistellae TaxID=2494560 RepID=A0A5J4FSN3_9FLAO|nr:LytTR family DNA-binding domain-containing protein [Patiriisocius marinistellae]GEQ85207.1 DNA-binding response regulator [Patiriisocius marinistellae]